MPTQPQIVNSQAIFPFDGYVVEIGDTESAMTSLGACDGDAAGEMTYTTFRIQDSGGEIIADQLKNPQIAMNFTLMEFNCDKIADMSGGLFTKTVTAATPVADFEEVLAANSTTLDKFIAFSNQNYAGPSTVPVIPTNIEVTEDPTGTPVTLVLNTDYSVIQDANGNFGVVPLASGSWDVTKENELEYDYTPRASIALDAGSTSIIVTSKIVRFIHTDSNGKIRKLTVYSTNLGDAGFTFNFGSALNDGVNTTPISLTGKLDETRADGKQLLQYYDEQQVA